jgi:hypothetical protein
VPLLQPKLAADGLTGVPAQLRSSKERDGSVNRPNSRSGTSTDRNGSSPTASPSSSQTNLAQSQSPSNAPAQPAGGTSRSSGFLGSFGSRSGSSSAMSSSAAAPVVVVSSDNVSIVYMMFYRFRDLSARPFSSALSRPSDVLCLVIGLRSIFPLVLCILSLQLLRCFLKLMVVEERSCLADTYSHTGDHASRPDPTLVCLTPSPCLHS